MTRAFDRLRAQDKMDDNARERLEELMDALRHGLRDINKKAGGLTTDLSTTKEMVEKALEKIRATITQGQAVPADVYADADAAIEKLVFFVYNGCRAFLVLEYYSDEE